MSLSTCPLTASRSADCSTLRGRGQKSRGHLLVFVRGTTSRWVHADRRGRCPTSSDVGLHSSIRYGGACPWRHLKTMTAVLKVIRCRIGSQCKLCRTGVMCSYTSERPWQDERQHSVYKMNINVCTQRLRWTKPSTLTGVSVFNKICQVDHKMTRDVRHSGAI